MTHIFNRLFRRREGERILKLEKELMITQDQVDSYVTRINADTAKIADLESQISAAKTKAATDAQTISDLQAKLAAIPAPAPDVNASGLEAAISAQEQELAPTGSTGGIGG